MDVDGEQREFIVHVPSGYKANTPTPVVFMFHASLHDGEDAYKNTNWADKANRETFITVYPSSWKYRLVGQPGLQAKWNTYELKDDVQPGTKLQDDVKFVRLMLDRIKATFNVDSKRIFTSGMSNGGVFVLGRMIKEMNKEFAAFSIAGVGLMGGGSAGSPPPTLTNVSLYSVFGTNDQVVSDLSGRPLPFPFTPREIASDPTLSGALKTGCSLLSLKDTPTVDSKSNYTNLIFDQSLVGAHNEFIYMMILGMDHSYPNARNNAARIEAVDIFWEFFMKHPKQ